MSKIISPALILPDNEDMNLTYANSYCYWQKKKKSNFFITYCLNPTQALHLETLLAKKVFVFDSLKGGKTVKL